MIYDGEEGMNRVMFPVESVDVYAETEPGRRDLVPGKKAIINTDTRKVLSVVGHRYGLLHNSRALELAKGACIVAFPNTVPAKWLVDTIEAPESGGHCRIDLHYDGKSVGYDWSFSKDAQDRYHPFLRVTNSYNTTRVFSMHFGFTRLMCMNSVVADESVRISLAHTGNIEEKVKAGINQAKFQKVASRFQDLLQPLRNTEIPRNRFRPVLLSVLNINKPEGMPQDREEQWKELESFIDGKVEKYSKETSANVYALFNAITDVATRPPAKGDVGYGFIRRERHSLQVLAGRWLVEFSNSLQRQDFILNEYLEKPSRDLLLTDNGTSRRGFRR